MATKYQFKTSGMHCSSCSMLVTIDLEDLSGVQAVECDHASGATLVTVDETLVDKERIIKTIRGAGYETEFVGEVVS
jgi:copper chaperone